MDASARPTRRGGLVRRALSLALRTRRGQVAAALVLGVLVVAFVGPLLPHPSASEFLTAPFAKPGDPDAELLGGDALGRDVLARTLTGGRALLVVSALATVLAVVVGAVIGVTAAYRRGVVDGLLMRTVDVVLAMPQLVFVLLMVSVIGPKDWLLVLSVGLSQAPATARVVYAAAQEVCERDFVKAVASWGVPGRIVLRRHVLPNLVTPLMVEAGLRLSFSIILVSGLSFLGQGTQSTGANWGVMINENRLGLSSNYWGVLAPAILLALLSVGTNMFADAIARANLGEDRGEQLVIAATSTPGSEP